MTLARVIEALLFSAQKPLAIKEIADTIRALYGWGVQNLAYYPDNVFNNVPNPAALRPAFDSKPNNPLPVPVIR